MGLFNFGKKREYLLNWQRVVMRNSPDKLVMTEAQLKLASEMQARDYLSIINDCGKILGTTTKPDTFFSRLDLMKNTAACLVKLEPYVRFSGTSPTAAMKVLEANEQKAIYGFIVRYFADVFEKAENLKTEAGKKRRYQNCYDSLTKYFYRMDEHNQNYVRYNYRDKIGCTDI